MFKRRCVHWLSTWFDPTLGLRLAHMCGFLTPSRICVFYMTEEENQGPAYGSHP